MRCKYYYAPLIIRMWTKLKLQPREKEEKIVYIYRVVKQLEQKKHEENYRTN